MPYTASCCRFYRKEWLPPINRSMARLCLKLIESATPKARRTSTNDEYVGQTNKNGTLWIAAKVVDIFTSNFNIFQYKLHSSQCIFYDALATFRTRPWTLLFPWSRTCIPSSIWQCCHPPHDLQACYWTWETGRSHMGQDQGNKEGEGAFRHHSTSKCGCILVFMDFHCF